MAKTRFTLLLAACTFFFQMSLAQGPSGTPAITAPADITISCIDDLHDLGVTGEAVFPGGGTVTYSDVNFDLAPCGGGSVLRRFTAGDGEGNVHVAEQKIHFRETGQRQVEMPESFCTNRPGRVIDLSPDNLPDGQGYPIVRGDGCGLGMYHEDEVALLDGGDRVRIRRTWTVCDPCNGLPCRKHVQVIGSVLIDGTDASTLRTVETGTGSFELLQNRPNPFNRGTVIGFVLPQESEITLTVQQADGRVLHTWEGIYPSGFNEVKYDNEGSPGQGMLFYTLTTPGHRATKRMVVTR